MSPCVLVLVLLTHSAAAADDERITFGEHDVPTVFYISKSANRNRVEVGVRLTDECVLVGTKPAFDYWRLLEKGADETETLSSRSRKAYGIASQVIASKGVARSARVELAALPGRPIRITSTKAGASCDVRAFMRIDGENVRFNHAHVQLKGAFGLRVKHIDLHGVSLETGKPVVERIKN